MSCFAFILFWLVEPAGPHLATPWLKAMVLLALTWLSWEREASDAVRRGFGTNRMPSWYTWTFSLNVLVDLHNILAGSPPFCMLVSKSYWTSPDIVSEGIEELGCNG